MRESLEKQSTKEQEKDRLRTLGVISLVFVVVLLYAFGVKSGDIGLSILSTFKP